MNVLLSLSVVLFVTLHINAEPINPLRFGAFNVQVLGASKMSKDHVVDVLVKIILRYDIILIQEVRDSSGKAMPDLLDRVNTAEILQRDENAYCGTDDGEDCEQTSGDFDMILSDRLGRTTSKEQYAFLFRKSRVTCTVSYHYDDGPEEDKEDHFEREPFVARFTSPSTLVKDFAVISIHTKPSDAVKEIDMLTDVYDDVISRWDLEDVIIAGDYNGACNYVKSNDWPQIRLRSQDRFTWLVEDNVDTNVAGDVCAYDRIVVGGAVLTNSVWPRSTGAFYFDDEYGLTSDEARDVSDHYPVETLLLPELTEDTIAHISSGAGFVASDGRQVSETCLQELRDFVPTAEMLFDEDGQFVSISIVQTIDDLEEARRLLKKIRYHVPGLVSDELAHVVETHLVQLEKHDALSGALAPLRPDNKSFKLTYREGKGCEIAIIG